MQFVLTAATLAALPAVAFLDSTGPGGFLHVELRPVALSGHQAPGLARGSLFQFFGPNPGLSSPVLGAARLDGTGNLAFAAHTTDPASGNQGVPGLWGRSGTVLMPLALRGDPAPGTQSTFDSFPNIYFGMTPDLVDGRALFSASLPGSATGLWSDRTGVLELVALQNQTLPGLPAGAGIHAPEGVLVGGGRVVIHADYAVPGGAPSNEREGFWRDDGQAVELLIRDGAQAPGCGPGVVFGEANMFAQGSFDRWDVGSSGRIAFNGFVKGPGVDLEDDEGVWAETAAGLRLVARERDSAPGAGQNAIFLDGAGLHTFGNAYHAPVQINGAGTVLFGAGLEGVGFDHGDSLWLHRGGQLELVVKAFSGASSSNADPAPGFPAGTTFQGFGAVRLNAHDEIAFSGVAGGETGIWWTRAGVLELVARSGGPVPQIPQATFSNYGLGLRDLGDSGSLLYTGGFTGPGIDYTTGQALFLVLPGLPTQILVRKGQSVEVSAGDLRTVEAFGTDGPFEAGVVSLKLLFTDGSSGLFTAGLRK